ncbi:MAG: DUF1761 domain-containing protein [Bacteroidota bacterium]
MGEMHVNYLAILVSAILSMAIGAIWYSPMLFAKQWMVWNNMTAEDMKKVNPGPLYAQSFFATLVTYFVLALILRNMNATSAVEGMKTAFMLWLGFITTVQFTANLFSSKKIQSYLLDTGYQLVTMLIAGIVLSLWQ